MSILLTQNYIYFRRYLWNVNIWSLGPGDDHDLETVELGERSLGWRAGFVTSVVENSIDLILEGLPQGVTRRGLQLVTVSFVDDLNNLILGFLDGGDDVRVGARIGNCVTDTDAVTFEEQPVVNNGLNVAVEFSV